MTNVMFTICNGTGILKKKCTKKKKLIILWLIASGQFQLLTLCMPMRISYEC